MWFVWVFSALHVNKASAPEFESPLNGLDQLEQIADDLLDVGPEVVDHVPELVRVDLLPHHDPDRVALVAHAGIPGRRDGALPLARVAVEVQLEK